MATETKSIVCVNTLQESHLNPDELSRYARQIILPEIGRKGQERLRAGRVLIVGLGGLGSPVALYLAAAGVGHLGLCDFDKVELHNLQRQILHRTSSEGKLKVESAREELNALNPWIEVSVHPEGINCDNALQVMRSYDVIIDGTDNFPVRYLINDAAYFARKPLVSGSIYQFEGQVSLYAPHDGGPCYRCIYPEMPGPGEVPNCAEAGVMGALCGLVGSIQAMECIKFLAGAGDTLAGRMLAVDTLQMRFRTINLKRYTGCPLCGQSPSIRELNESLYVFNCTTNPNHTDQEPMFNLFGNRNDTKANRDESVESASPNGTRKGEGQAAPLSVSVEEVNTMLASNEKPLILDVREPMEWEICHIASSLHIPMARVAQNLDALPPDRHILVICHHGMRSARVASFLRDKGFENVSNITGGINAWARKIDTAMRRY